MRWIIVLGLLLAFEAEAGPLSKFDERPPVSAGRTNQKLEDVERCLLDIPGYGLPYVYAQLDRPDDVTIMWNRNMDINSTRIDLHREGGATRFRSWMPNKYMSSCAPSA